MEQPDYLILNPVFNSFPYNRKYHKYVHIETTCRKKNNTIIWNKDVVLQPGRLFIKMKDISNYKEYMLEKIGRI